MGKGNSPVTAGPDLTPEVRLRGGQRVLLDSDLAALYGVTTSAFNQAVRRNMARFPLDFVRVLTNQDVASLRSQFVILKTGRGQHRKYAPLAFTEHGAIMAATIMNRSRAVQMAVYVVRAFVRARELNALKKSVTELDAETRRQFDTVYEAILGLMNEKARRQ